MFKRVSDCIHLGFDCFLGWLEQWSQDHLLGFVSVVKMCACVAIVLNTLAAFSDLDTINHYRDPDKHRPVATNWAAGSVVDPHFFPGQEQPARVNSFPVQGRRGYQGDAIWFDGLVKESDLSDIALREDCTEGVVRRTVLLYTFAHPDHECSSWRQTDSHGYDRACSHRFLVRKVGPRGWTPSEKDITLPMISSREARIMAKELNSIRLTKGLSGESYITLCQTRAVDMVRPRGYTGGLYGSSCEIEESTILTTFPNGG